jgi:hypothetical protein
MRRSASCFQIPVLVLTGILLVSRPQSGIRKDAIQPVPRVSPSIIGPWCRSPSSGLTARGKCLSVLNVVTNLSYQDRSTGSMTDNHGR